MKRPIDAGDVDHECAVNALRAVPGRFITFEAAITEAQRGLANHPKALRALRRLVARLLKGPFMTASTPAEKLFRAVPRLPPRRNGFGIEHGTTFLPEYWLIRLASTPQRQDSFSGPRSLALDLHVASI